MNKFESFSQPQSQPEKDESKFTTKQKIGAACVATIVITGLLINANNYEKSPSITGYLCEGKQEVIPEPGDTATKLVKEHVLPEGVGNGDADRVTKSIGPNWKGETKITPTERMYHGIGWGVSAGEAVILPEQCEPIDE